MNNRPRVTIGIPIYFGEVYLKETLECLLAQDYKSFEIILTDNNPGQLVQAIAEEYASKYNFIKYIIHPKNIGALQNWNSLLHFCQTEYFICCGGHDILSKNFISTLVDVLDNNPLAAVAYGRTYLMSEKGVVQKEPVGYFDTSNSSIVQRFHQIFWGNQEPLYGLMRMAVLKKTRLQKEIVGSGSVWLNEIGLYGDFKVCPEAIRYRRENREKQSYEKQLKRYHLTLFSEKRIRLFPHWRMFASYIGVGFQGSIKLTTRIRLLINITFAFILRYGHNLLYDIKSLIVRIIKFQLY